MSEGARVAVSKGAIGKEAKHGGLTLGVEYAWWSVPQPEREALLHNSELATTRGQVCSGASCHV